MEPAEDLEAFMVSTERDPATGCLMWTGNKFRNGYGRFGRQGGAHRWLFGRDHGYLPPVVMHLCDTPACVEIRHLLPGTQADNMADKVEKGRQARGDTCGRSKLTESECREIQAESRLGVLTQQMLAEAYGVGQTQISRVIRGDRSGLPQVRKGR